jgi:GH25 family lysozyme M1 (1,4-beta-N-acetylmuramidase)
MTDKPTSYIDQDSRSKNKTSMIPGIDISKWQGSTWNPTKTKNNGVKWIYIRALTGVVVDSMMNYYVDLAKKNNIPFGLYSFFQPKTDPTLQAKALADLYEKLKPNLVPMYDIEDNMGLASINLQVKAYVDASDMLISCKGIIYTSAQIWNSFVNLHIYGDHILWLPRYPTEDTPPINAEEWDTFAFSLNRLPAIPSGWNDFDCWQFSSQGNKAASIYGFADGDLDLNILYSDVWDKMILNKPITPIVNEKKLNLVLVTRSDSANKSVYAYDGVRARICIDQVDIDSLMSLGASVGDDGKPISLPSNIIDTAIALR